MSIKHECRRLLWKLGYDIIPFVPRNSPIARRARLLKSYGINVVLDVGASTGQFGRILRHDLGYTGRIVSFEPIASAFAALNGNAENDPLWDVFNFAFGDQEIESKINISKNSDSSSILEILPRHVRAAPDSIYIASETIEIRTIDSLLDDLASADDQIYLKIDTQGFEHKVIKGAENSLPNISTIQVETSLTPLYKGGILFPEMCSLLQEKGYALVAIEPGFSDSVTGQLLQLDGIFHRFG